MKGIKPFSEEQIRGERVKGLSTDENEEVTGIWLKVDKSSGMILDGTDLSNIGLIMYSNTDVINKPARNC